jgi:hypothetical protein
MRLWIVAVLVGCGGWLAPQGAEARDAYLAAQPRGMYATRAVYGYGYYRPYGTYYAPNHMATSYPYGVIPTTSTMPPGYLPPRFYGGYGYWGGRGSSYYYGGGLNRGGR